MKKLMILPLLLLAAACGRNKNEMEDDTLTRLSQAVGP